MPVFLKTAHILEHVKASFYASLEAENMSNNLKFDSPLREDLENQFKHLFRAFLKGPKTDTTKRYVVPDV